MSRSEEKQFINYWKDKGVEAWVDDLDDRAGNVLSGNGVKIKKPFHGKLKGCNNYNRPFRIFHVLFNGDVVLCCRDWRQEVILGNIMEDNIYHVWNSPQYEYIRKVITSKEESHEEFLCSRCIYASKEP